MSWQTYVSLVPQRNGACSDFSRYVNSIMGEVRDFDTRLLKSGNRTVQSSRKMNLREDGENLIVEVELPRFEEKDLDISLSEGMLTLRAERSMEQEIEGKPSKKVLESWSREIQLPYEVEENKIDAKLSKGILTITLPKLPEIKPEVKKIAVHS